MSKLIILRGNSGSGKTTIAKRLHQELQPHFADRLQAGTMLVQQDVIRRDILRVRDFPGNPAIRLIEDIVITGSEAGYDVILEGILGKSVYGDMLHRLLSQFGEHANVYYFDISFEETTRRHLTKSNSEEFGEEDMRRWFRQTDVLGVSSEVLFTDEHSEEEIVQHIMQQLRPPK